MKLWTTSLPDTATSKQDREQSLVHSQPTPDISTGPRDIWGLTWPQMLMMFFVFCLGLTDVWTAGRIGGDVQAAFGLVAQCAMFLQVLVMAMSSGAMAAISQSLGARRQRRARRYVGMIVLCSLLLGLLVACIAYAGRNIFFRLLMTPADILPITLDYWGITLFTLPASYIFVATGMLFRATRQVFPPLWISAIMALCNLAGNLGFGLGWFGLPAFGYHGIAWTTFACTCLGATLNCLFLARTGYLSKADIPPLRWMRAGAPYLLKVALPAGAAQIVWHTGYVTLFAVAASLPVDSINALAGMTAGMRAEALLFLPGMAFSMTASVMVGNCLGAGNKDQALRLALQLAAAGSLFMSLVAAALWPFIGDMAAALSTVPGAQVQAVSYLRYNFISTPFTVISMVLGGAMTGAGATRYNLMVYGGSFWIVRLPLAWWLGHYVWRDAAGIFLGMLASQVVQSLIMLWVLLRADWTRFAMHAGRGHEK